MNDNDIIRSSIKYDGQVLDVVDLAEKCLKYNYYDSLVIKGFCISVDNEVITKLTIDFDFNREDFKLFVHLFWNLLNIDITNKSKNYVSYSGRVFSR